MVIPCRIECSIIFCQFVLCFYCLTTHHFSLSTNILKYTAREKSFQLKPKLRTYIKASLSNLLTIYNFLQDPLWSIHWEYRLQIEESLILSTKLRYSRKKLLCKHICQSFRCCLEITGLKLGVSASKPGGKTIGAWGAIPMFLNCFFIGDESFCSSSVGVTLTRQC